MLKLYKNDQLIIKGKLNDIADYFGKSKDYIYYNLPSEYRIEKAYKQYKVYDTESNKYVFVGDVREVADYLVVSVNTIKSSITRKCLVLRQYRIEKDD